MHCSKVEEKLGIHGSPTCIMQFGDNGECVGALLGEENKGLRNMFVMMNSARLDVGVQGVGVAERAFQQALAYAQERRQGRAPGVRGGPQIPIFEHADVRRMLYTMKAIVEAGRGICYANAVAYDLARHAPDEEAARRAKALEELLTPISKAWCADRAFEAAGLGVQVHGGMGYVEETGAAQYVRDSKITAIYEGANGIQAMDLVGRKLQGDGGAAAGDFIQNVRDQGVIAKAGRRAELQVLGERLLRSADALEASTQWLLSAAAGDQNDVLAGASPYLKQFGNVAGGLYLAKGAVAAAIALGEADADADYYEAKIAMARFYADTFLVEAEGLTPTVTAGAAGVAALSPQALAG